MDGDSAMRTRRASSTGSWVVEECSASVSMMVRMSRTCTESSSSSWSTFWNVVMDTIFGMTSSINLGASLATCSTNCCVSVRLISLAACTCIKCDKWVAITVSESTTVKPAICAASFWRSSIQWAGRPKAGSVVWVPISGVLMPPGLMARNMPGKASPSPTITPRRVMR
ncbi:hypothetical protein GY14_16515 [Delftia tsuruhatensis]|nr:hypothetical protein GY14_16515 [Delftia tsuruhatensis]